MQQNINQAIYSITASCIMGYILQSTFMPPFLDSFPELHPYFVLLFLSTLFALTFFIIYVVMRYCFDVRLPNNLQYPTQTKIIITSIFDATNGIGVVYPGGTTRLPAPIQVILGVLAIPLTYLLRKLTCFDIQEREITKKQKQAVILAFISFTFSCIPYIIEYANSNSEQNKYMLFWITFFTIGITFGCLMNVATENVVENTIKNDYMTLSQKILFTVWFEVYRSTYQALTMLVYSFVDIIPFVGTTTNSNSGTNYINVWINVYDCLIYFMTNSKPFIMGMLFAVGYIITYISGDILIGLQTANYAQIASSIAIPLTVITLAILSQLIPNFLDRDITTIELIFQIPASMIAGYASYMYKNAKSETLYIQIP